MKKKGLFGFLAMLFLLAVMSCTALAATPLSQNGKLSVKGTQIVNSKGKAFQIKGVSTHGLAWFPQYVSKAAFQELRDNWGVNTVRLAMYTAEYNGYCTGGSANQKNLKNLVDKGVKAATDLGMYAIIDWHVLQDRDPNTYKTQAVSFFKEMAKKYKNHKNVLYEICNEPNSGVSWSQVKSYANKVIKEIRKIDKDAIIIVGTPTWSQDVDQAAKSPITGQKNIVYTLHFYADTHRDSLRAKAENAIKAGLPLLVSEFSICDASGSGAINKSEADKWISLLDKYKIGYTAWSLSNKNETSALIKSSCSKTSGWSWSDLSAAGQWLVKTYGGKLAKNTSVQTGGTDKKPAAADKKVTATAANAKATLQKTGGWQGGSRYYTQYKLTIKNTGKKEISSWKVRVTFKSAIKKDSGWNATYTYKNKYVTIKPVSYNKKIAAKKSVTDIGFILSSGVENNKIVSIKFL